MTAQNPGWGSILEPGETVLWQGQPDPTVRLQDFRIKDGVFGLVFSGFALFWMSQAALIAAQDGPPAWILPLFGLPFLVLGVQKAGGALLWQAWIRRNTWYTLTSKRAFIATDLLGRKSLSAYAITPDTVFDHLEDQGHLWFGFGEHKSGFSRRRHKIGFSYLPESRPVFDLMLQVQRNAL